MDIDLTEDEKKAVTSLKRLANRWPKNLWLFSASGTLCVMRTDSNGEKVLDGEGFDQDYIVGTINISNDGGDW
jgi:hypothetical protein